jgi:glycosyltransferase involved in cell wall biosynthesis
MMRAMRVAFVVPAYQAERSIAAVVQGLCEAANQLAAKTHPAVIVVDDGSSDRTGELAAAQGAFVLRLPQNRGKGAALISGFAKAAVLGASAVVTVDADGQHPIEEALKLAQHPAPTNMLVLGVRDLERDGAPRANRFSNRFSNVWMSWFTHRRLSDTQCGLRRYPLAETLALGLGGHGYELEAEVILKAARTGLGIVEVPVRVIYPPEAERVSHFRSVRDPARIVGRILYTVATTRFRPGAP